MKVRSLTNLPCISSSALRLLPSKTWRRRIFRSFFFFQAEDGIRDHCVTGVQTCALPIFDTLLARPKIRDSVIANDTVHFDSTTGDRIVMDTVTGQVQYRLILKFDSLAVRSEERRVGKECRCGGRPDRVKE